VAAVSCLPESADQLFQYREKSLWRLGPDRWRDRAICRLIGLWGTIASNGLQWFAAGLLENLDQFPISHEVAA
jgi:hypothetical protein